MFMWFDKFILSLAMCEKKILHASIKLLLPCLCDCNLTAALGMPNDIFRVFDVGIKVK